MHPIRVLEACGTWVVQGLRYLRFAAILLSISQGMFVAHFLVIKFNQGKASTLISNLISLQLNKQILKYSRPEEFKLSLWCT